MEQEIKIFEHEKFGKIRVIMVNSEPWFVGKDVATALKYSDTFAALKQHVPDKFKRVINAKILQQMASQSKISSYSFLEFDSPRGLTFINEAGLYKLILRSKLPTAEEFSDWVCEEMLPSIRKIGIYSTEQIMKQFWNSIINAEPQFAYVYVLEMNNGTTKVGVSSDLKKRIGCIESNSGLRILRYYSSSYFLRPMAFLIELILKEKFFAQRVEGEFFSVDFNAACDALDALDKLITALPSALETECVNKLLEVVKMFSDTPEGKALLLKAENILVDKKLV